MLPSSEPAWWRRGDRRTRARSTGMGAVLTKKGSPAPKRRRRHSAVIRRGSCFSLQDVSEAKMDTVEHNLQLT
jgi:hypothetical protein